MISHRFSFSSLFAVFFGVGVFLAPARSEAIGFGVGLELGGFAGASDVLNGGAASPHTFGGGLALMLSAELYDENFIRLQTLLRVEGNGFALAGADFGGAGGAGGADLLLRTGLAIPLVPVEPFVELGAGAAAGAVAGTRSASSVDAALDESFNQTAWIPAGYVGAGVTVALPLLPYFELRVGSHVGQVVPFDGDASSGSAGFVGRAEAHLGVGFRI